MDNFSITQYGKPLDKSKYTIDLDTKTFNSEENDLVLDFNGLDGWIFMAGNYSGNGCTFTTGRRCTFRAGNNCTFKTGSGCTFITGNDCIFKTGNGLVIDVILPLVVIVILILVSYCIYVYSIIN